MTKKQVEIPEDYLSLDDLNKNYLTFYRNFMKVGKDESPMMVWFDEDADVFAEIFDVEYEQPEAGPDGRLPDEIKHTSIAIKQVKAREPYQITVRNFVHLIGDPAHCYWHDKKPKEGEAKFVKDTKWASNRNLYTDRFRRGVDKQDVDVYMPTGTVRVPVKYQKGTYQVQNTDLGLWGKMPKMYVLPPDHFKLVRVKKDKNVNETAAEFIAEKGWKSGRKFTKPDLAAAKKYLVDKGKIDELSSQTMVRIILEEAMTGGNENSEEDENETITLED